MPEQSAVPLIVLTRQQDHVEIINSSLRNAGHPVHCSWIRDLSDLGDALIQIPAEMLIAHVGDDGADAAAILEIRGRCAGTVPVLLIRD
ncbi:MAG TPA: hypothetical protein VLT59_15275, partial [Steroidobacteraceae bacterium]|nr:hypothetical protein [Steroidobacteraceae bacterium]